jgi:hypothetical protein
VAERHSLAPPVDPPARRPVEPAERPTEEAHPLAYREPEPAPEPPAADVLARHTPSAPARHSDQQALESGAPPRRRDVEPPAAEPARDLARNEDFAAATERLQPAGGRLPEREPEGSESATEQLRVEPSRSHRRDDDHRHRRAHRHDYADYDRNDDEDDDLGDLPDDAREDDRADFRADFRGDFRGDFRDGNRDGHEPAEEVFPEPLSPHPLAAPRPLPPRDESRPARPTPLPTPPHTPVRSSDTRSRPTVTPISRPAVANPIPMVRRGGPAPIPRPLPVTEPRPAVRRLDDDRDDGRDYRRDDLEPLVDERPERPAADRRPPRPEEPQPARGQTPAFDSLSDPLNGPLNQPLLAPLLDPTRPEDDPLGLADRPPAPAEPQDDEWSEEWLSGTWAMAPSALVSPAESPPLDERADVRPEREADPPDVESVRPAPRPVPRSRHRFTDEPAAANGFPNPVRSRADEGDDGGDGDDPEHEHVGAGDHKPDRPELGLRPDSIARLSDADRQLLARLQAELLDGRRQRVGRRIINGTAATTNGSHRGPPDFAG